MDAIAPIGTVQADDETARPVEMGVHHRLQGTGAERLAQRGHAPQRSGVPAARLGELDASLVQERGDVLGREKSAQQHLGRGGVDDRRRQGPAGGSSF